MRRRSSLYHSSLSRTSDCVRLGLSNVFHFHVRTSSAVTGRRSLDTSAFSSRLRSRGLRSLASRRSVMRTCDFGSGSSLSQIRQIEGLSFGHVRSDFPGVTKVVMEQDIVVLFPVQDPQQHPPDVSLVQAHEAPINSSSLTLAVKVRNGERVTAVAC